MHRSSRFWQRWLGITLVVLMLTGCLGPVPPTAPPVVLPVDFGSLPALWPASGSEPGSHQVALFRCRFESAAPLGAGLQIFADTRYAAWLDGEFVGRGPARFSTRLREYDVFSLPQIETGAHVLAVQVQWAPNARRSDSIAPLLMAQITAENGARLACGGLDEWKALLSDAWRTDSAPVHTQGTIGPTELLDLRRLPAGWNEAAFEDSAWLLPVQVVAAISPSISRPRSIEPLVSVPVSPTLLDAGRLSVGMSLQDWSGGGEHNITFSLAEPYLFDMQAISGTQTAPLPAIRIDGSPLEWLAPAAGHPDIYFASVQMEPGTHSLSLVDESGLGSVLTVPAEIAGTTIEPGPNAGRRMLLAAATSDPGAVRVSDDLAAITFETLPAYLVLDLGRTIHGRLTAQVTGPAGSTLDIGWDERLMADSLRPLPFPGSLHPAWNQVDSWTLDGEQRELTTLDNRAGRYILVESWGPGPVTITDLQIVEERYPLALQGSFESGDPAMERLWQASIETLYPNLTDAYTDTPWRERGQWWGDVYVEARTNRVTFGDKDLLRRGLELMALEYQPDAAPGRAPTNGTANMIDYFMLWVHDLADYQRLYEDPQLLDLAYPVVSDFLQQLDGWRNPETGLLDLPQTAWSQTVYIDTYGFVQRYGQSTAVNALYYSTLMRASELAILQGDPDAGVKWQAQARTVRESANRLLYQADQGSYLTHLFQGAAYPPTPQAQAWALEFGLVPAGDEQRVASSLMNLLQLDSPDPVVSVYASFFVLDALGKAGRVNDGLDVLRAYYLPVIDSGSPTLWENWFADLDYTQSLSHGWGSAPAWFLSTYLLGARQDSPSSWSVTPAMTGVTSASGSIPINGGLLEVAWENRGCEHRWVTTETGAPGQGQIIITARGFSQLLLDGQPAWQDGKPLISNVTADTDRLILTVDGQPHRVDLTGCMP